MGAMFYRTSPDAPLQSLRVGEYVEVNGARRKVVALRVEEAPEDDEELDVLAGDYVTVVEFAPAE